MKRKFLLVEARKLHPSSILPKREHDPEISESARREGIQQPIIVRPLPGREDEYEIVDGHGRVETLDGNTKVVVDLRYDLKKSDVFKTSEATFKRNDRTTYDRAVFYKSWVDAVIEENGKERGAQKRVAEEAGLSEGEISQYLTIWKLFQVLEPLASEEKFDALKKLGINPLYRLAKIDNEQALLQVAKKILRSAEVSPEVVESVVNEYEDSYMDQLVEVFRSDEKNEVEATEETPKTVEVSHSEKEVFQCQKLAWTTIMYADEVNQNLTQLSKQIHQHPEVFATHELAKQQRKIIRTLKGLRSKTNNLFLEMKKFENQWKQAIGADKENQI